MPLKYFGLGLETSGICGTRRREIGGIDVMFSDFSIAVYAGPQTCVGYRMKYDRDGSVGFLVAAALASVRPHRVGCHLNTGLRSV